MWGTSKMRHFQNKTVRKWDTPKMRHSENERLRKWDTSKMRHCKNETLRKWEDLFSKWTIDKLSHYRTNQMSLLWMDRLTKFLIIVVTRFQSVSFTKCLIIEKTFEDRPFTIFPFTRRPISEVSHNQSVSLTPWLRERATFGPPVS